VPQTGRLVTNRAGGGGGTSGAKTAAAFDFPSIPANRAADESLTPRVRLPAMRWAPGMPGGFEAGLVATSITAVDTVAVRVRPSRA